MTMNPRLHPQTQFTCANRIVLHSNLSPLEEEKEPALLGPVLTCNANNHLFIITWDEQEKI